MCHFLSMVYSLNFRSASPAFFIYHCAIIVCPINVTHPICFKCSQHCSWCDSNVTSSCLNEQSSVLGVWKFGLGFFHILTKPSFSNLGWKIFKGHAWKRMTSNNFFSSLRTLRYGATYILMNADSTLKSASLVSTLQWQVKTPANNLLLDHQMSAWWHCKKPNTLSQKPAIVVPEAE